jgi:hypothetical protein
MFTEERSIQSKFESAGHIVERDASCLHLLASPSCYLLMAPTSAYMVDNMVMRYVRLPTSTTEDWPSRCFSKAPHVYAQGGCDRNAPQAFLYLQAVRRFSKSSHSKELIQSGH